MILNLIALILGCIGIVATGFYPGIIVLLLLALIPIASKIYAKIIISKSVSFRKNIYTTLIVINLLSIPIALWMTFVIMIDRIIPYL